MTCLEPPPNLLPFRTCSVHPSPVDVIGGADGGDDVGIQIGRCSLFKYLLV